MNKLTFVVLYLIMTPLFITIQVLLSLFIVSFILQFLDSTLGWWNSIAILFGGIVSSIITALIIMYPMGYITKNKNYVLAAGMVIVSAIVLHSGNSSLNEIKYSLIEWGVLMSSSLIFWKLGYKKSFNKSVRNVEEG